MYTPQFSDISCISVRRLAWALQTTMGAAVTRLVDQLPALVDPARVCLACKDKSKCGLCVFSGRITGSTAGLEF